MRNRKKDDAALAELYAEQPLTSLTSEQCKHWQETGCKNKSTFNSKRKATYYADRFSRQYQVKYSIYLCPFCGHWHLTTKEKQDGR